MTLNRPKLSVVAGAPLPRQTGHADFPHPAFARVVSSSKYSQRLKAQMLQVSISTDARAWPPAPLTPSPQVAGQPLIHERVELPEPISRVPQFEVVGPAA